VQAQNTNVAFSYDAAGALVKKGDNHLHYGADGRIAKAGEYADAADAQAVSYVYNAGVETSTGPLGHGLPVGAGCATAAQLAGQGWRTFVVLGDGEMQEGSNWEAAMYAAQHGLGGLTAIVDRNRLQQGATTADTNDLEPMADKWVSFGWETHVIDGHSFEALQAVLERPPSCRPRAVIANTVKGKGVSFMENVVEWHHKVPDPAQFEAAMRELSI
jgi:transketolase